jgi:isopenicillin-N epimerase
MQPWPPRSELRSRRGFLRDLAAGGVVVPSALESLARQPGTGRVGTERFWEEVRRQFSFHEEQVPMNAANLCPSPRVVAERVFALTRDIDRDCSSQNRRKFGSLLEASRTKVAAALGATVDEVALVRNTSEANNIINNGLPLEAGDNVVLWNQNHPTNNVAWDVRGARFGVTVTRVSTPAQPTGIDELVGVFERALTSRTRVLAVTHASNLTGLRLPVAELCEMAHRRGIHVHVDGAQSWGALQLDLAALDCDSFTGSAHKWFVGPKEVGLLYVKAEHVGRIWPSEIAPSWGNQVEPRPVGARKFESMGQRDDAALAAIGTTVDFHERIGAGRIEARITALATRLKEGLSDAGYRLVTPMAPELSAGVCIAEVEGERGALVTALYQHHGIAGAATGGLRLCPHLYNTIEHVERAVRGAEALRRKG